MEIKFNSKLLPIIEQYAAGMAADEDDPRVTDALKKKSKIHSGRRDEERTRIILDIESAIELSNHLSEQGYLIGLIDPTMNQVSRDMMRAGREMGRDIIIFVTSALSI